MPIRETQPTSDDSRIVLGVIGLKTYWHSMCLSATPTDDELKRMSDQQLISLAYANPKTMDGVRMERYRAGDYDISKKHGKEAHEEFIAPCRASLHLCYREAKRTARDMVDLQREQARNF